VPSHAYSDNLPFAARRGRNPGVPSFFVSHERLQSLGAIWCDTPYGSLHPRARLTVQEIVAAVPADTPVPVSVGDRRRARCGEEIRGSQNAELKKLGYQHHDRYCLDYRAWKKREKELGRGGEKKKGKIKKSIM